MPMLCSIRTLTTRATLCQPNAAWHALPSARQRPSPRPARSRVTSASCKTTAAGAGTRTDLLGKVCNQLQLHRVWQTYLIRAWRSCTRAMPKPGQVKHSARQRTQLPASCRPNWGHDRRTAANCLADACAIRVPASSVAGAHLSQTERCKLNPRSLLDN